MVRLDFYLFDTGMRDPSPPTVVPNPNPLQRGHKHSSTVAQPMNHNLVLIVGNLNRLSYLLCRIAHPLRAYYFRRARSLEKTSLRLPFVHLTTDVCPECFRESLMESFDFTNSAELKCSHDYRICRRALRRLLPGAQERDMHVAVKRLFHRSIYEHSRRKKLMEHVRRIHPLARICVIGVIEDCDFPGISSATAACMPARLFCWYLFLRRLVVKLCAFGYLLRRFVSLRIRRARRARDLDVMFVAHAPHHMITELAKSVAARSVSVGFLMTGTGLPEQYQSLVGRSQCFRLADMAFTFGFFLRFLRSIVAFYVGSLRVNNVSVYKQLCVFASKLNMYRRAFEVVRPAFLITSEDYQEFNPRHFAARETHCPVVNILTSALVPPRNPYTSFCLIDKEASFSHANLDSLTASGCRIGSYIPLTHFGAFLSYMSPRLDEDRNWMDSLLGQSGFRTDNRRVLTYYSTGNKMNFSYIDIPIEVKLCVLGYLKEYVQANNDAILIIKLHPAEKGQGDFQREYATLLGIANVFFIDNSVSSYSLLDYSHVNISDLSTMGLHSDFFGYSTIIVDVLGVCPHLRNGAASHNLRFVETRERLFAAIDELSCLRPERLRTATPQRASAMFLQDVVEYVVQAKLQTQLALEKGLQSAPVA